MSKKTANVNTVNKEVRHLHLYNIIIEGDLNLLEDKYKILSFSTDHQFVLFCIF